MATTPPATSLLRSSLMIKGEDEKRLKRLRVEVEL
jgi:hypothetical protein